MTRESHVARRYDLLLADVGYWKCMTTTTCYAKFAGRKCICRVQIPYCIQESDVEACKQMQWHLVHLLGSSLVFSMCTESQVTSCLCFMCSPTSTSIKQQCLRTQLGPSVTTITSAAAGSTIGLFWPAKSRLATAATPVTAPQGSSWVLLGAMFTCTQLRCSGS